MAHVKGTGTNAVLVLADPSQTSKFTGFGGQDYLELTIRAKNVVMEVIILLQRIEPYGLKLRPNPHFLRKEEWMTVSTGKLLEFKNRLPAGITGEKATALFDNDNYDSDGDGISNALERAFGGDSLNNDTRSTLPRPIKSKPSGEEDHEFITFLKYQDSYNTEGIEYIVETSRDLRTWLPTTNADGAHSAWFCCRSRRRHGKSGLQDEKRKSGNGNDKIFIRVRVKTR